MKLSLQDREAEDVAERLVKERRLNSLPICPFTIAKDAGIQVASKPSESPGVSGVLMFVENQFGILYATHIENEGFIRFTVSHELGHYFIPGHCDQLFKDGVSVHQSRSGFISNDPFERQADVFAATLLMPEDLFIEQMRDAGQGFEAIDSLKDTFRTSITATAIRYARFADDPVAIIISSGEKVVCSFASQALEDVRGFKRLRKGDAISPRSCTAAFNKNVSRVKSGERDGGYSSLDEWFDETPSVEMKEDVVGLGSYGRTLTVLFTEDALPDEDDGDDGD